MALSKESIRREFSESLPGLVIVPLSRAKLSVVRSEDGTKKLAGNPEDPELLEQLHQVLTDPKNTEHKRVSSAWKHIHELVTTGRGVAAVGFTFGAITITVVGVGYEAIHRHGEDFGKIANLLNSYREQRNKK